MLAFFDLNPIHLGFVLLLALLLFGPQKLPEIGKQIGHALKELKKAGSDMMSTFNTDHEPDHKPYDYNYPSTDDNSVPYGATPAIEPYQDLTDYTIAGQPVHDSTNHTTPSSTDTSDYAIAGYSAHGQNGASSGGEAHTVAHESGAATATAEPKKEG